MSVLACDIGGTRVKLGLVEHGRLLAKKIMPADAQGEFRSELHRIRAEFDQLCKDAKTTPNKCRGIGLGFPALVNSRVGRVINDYGKYRDAPDIDLNAWARESFDLPLAIDNDARVALLGEWRYGAGVGRDNVAMIALGTGIGSAVISQGKLLRGPHFVAGNLCGHLTVNVDGLPCVCGNRGCYEAEAGSAHLPNVARCMEGFNQSMLARKKPLDYAAVFACAAAGDTVAMLLQDRAIRLWGALCVSMIHAFDLDRLVIGGGLLASAGVILPRLQAHVQTHASTPWGAVEIVAAQDPDHMGLLGCEPLVNEMLSRSHG